MYILERIAKHKEKALELEAEVKRFVQDTNNPLDERWKVFVTAKMGRTDAFIYHGFDHIDKDIFGYDCAVHCERNRVMYLVEVIEHLEECADIRDSKEEKDKILLLKEQVLKDFIWSFVYDW